MKARSADMLSKINTLYTALQIYKMENGAYPVLSSAESMTEEQMNAVLDVHIPLGTNMRFTYYRHAYVAIKYSKADTSFFISKGLAESSEHMHYQPGVTTCRAFNTNTKGLEVCRSLCGTLSPSETSDSSLCFL